MQQFKLFIGPIENKLRLETELNEWAAGKGSSAPYIKRTQLAMTTDPDPGGAVFVGVLVSYEVKEPGVTAPPGANVTLEQWSEFVLAILAIRRGRLTSVGGRAEVSDYMLKNLPIEMARVEGVREAISLALDRIAGSSLEKERVLMQGRDAIVAAVSRLFKESK